MKKIPSFAKSQSKGPNILGEKLVEIEIAH